MQNKILLFFIGILSFSVSLSGQQLWPGDVNNNGEVDVIDALWVGIAYGTTGPVRDNASINWQAEDITTLWAESFPNGINYAYADTDGNGLIDKDDIKDAIRDNFGLTHGVVNPDIYSSGTSGQDPALKLVNVTGTVQPSGMLDIDLSLGEMDLQANDFYGIGLTIDYDPTIIEEIGFALDTESWVTNLLNDETHELEVEDAVNGKFHMVITRKDQMPVTGFGKLGTLSLVIEDIVVGIATDTTIQLTIENVRMITPEMTEIEIVEDSVMITISETTSLNNRDTKISHVTVQPNPVKDFFVVKSHATTIKSVTIYNLHGKEISQVQGINRSEIKIPSPLIPSGIYVVKVTSEQKTTTHKIMIEHPIK